LILAVHWLRHKITGITDMVTRSGDHGPDDSDLTQSHPDQPDRLQLNASLSEVGQTGFARLITPGIF
jgi:hypothetical protein